MATAERKEADINHPPPKVIYRLLIHLFLLRQNMFGYFLPVKDIDCGRASTEQAIMSHFAYGIESIDNLAGLIQNLQLSLTSMPPSVT